MIVVAAWAAKPATREYSIQTLLQMQSPDSLVHWYKASTSTNNVLGSFGDFSHKIYHKLSLHKIAHLNNDHSLQMTVSVYKLQKNLLAMPPISYSATCILKVQC